MFFTAIALALLMVIGHSDNSLTRPFEMSIIFLGTSSALGESALGVFSGKLFVHLSSLQQPPGGLQLVGHVVINAAILAVSQVGQPYLATLKCREPVVDVAMSQ